MGRRALPGSTTWPSAMRSPSASAPSVRGASPQPSLHVRLRVCHLGREVPCCTEHEAWRDPLWRTRVLMSRSVGAGRGKRDCWTRSALPHPAPPPRELGGPCGVISVKAPRSRPAGFLDDERRPPGLTDCLCFISSSPGSLPPFPSSQTPQTCPRITHR